MPMFQLGSEYRLGSKQLPAKLEVGPDVSSLGSCYWRLDWTQDLSGAQFCPNLVAHVSQTEKFRLMFLGAVVSSADPAIILIAVDLPDRLVQKSSPFVKYFGKGKRVQDKLDSFELSKLQRSYVLNSDGTRTTGFPSVVLQVQFSQSPALAHLSGEELYNGWSPPANVFHEQPKQYLQLFLQKNINILKDMKDCISEAHGQLLDPWQPNVEVCLVSFMYNHVSLLLCTYMF